MRSRGVFVNRLWVVVGSSELSYTSMWLVRDCPQARQVVVMLDLVNSGLKPISTVVDAGIDGI